MKMVLIYITTANRKEAKLAGDALLKERLVACVNLLGPMESHYWWQGRLEAAREWLLLAKTRANLVPAVIKAVKALHSYQTPCIVSLPLVSGNPAFLSWLENETKAPTRIIHRAGRRATRNG